MDTAFAYDPKEFPEPGAGPSAARGTIRGLPPGTKLLGLAPIGVRWCAMVIKGRIKPAGNCPPGEFLVTHALIRGIWHEVI